MSLSLGDSWSSWSGAPDVLGSYSTRLDDLFGIYDETTPKWIEGILWYLILAWIFLYVFGVMWSALLLDDFNQVIIPKVLLAMGTLYRYVDPWYMMLPRMSTCIYLHLHTMHLIMNSVSLAMSLSFWKKGAGEHLGWVDYFTIPVWWSCSILGSVMSYRGNLGKSGSFTIGASGGSCGYTAFIIMMVIKLEGLNEQEAPHRYEALIGMMIPLILGLLPVNAGEKGSSTDYMAHCGGTLMGVAWALLLANLKGYSEESLKRLGYTCGLFAVGCTVLAFLEVYRQYTTGHSDRVVRAYFRWYKWDQIRLRRPPGERRRWTLAELQNIETKININARDPQSAALRRKEREARENDIFWDLQLDSDAARASV